MLYHTHMSSSQESRGYPIKKIKFCFGCERFSQLKSFHCCVHTGGVGALVCVQAINN